jgi:hypothetical protein
VSAVSDKAAEIKNTGISRVLVEFLEEKLDKYKSALVITNDTVTIYKLQGRAAELMELINKFKSEKMK